VFSAIFSNIPAISSEKQRILSEWIASGAGTAYPSGAPEFTPGF
jgi:hypothetical protein